MYYFYYSIRVSPSADVSNELIADTTADDKIKINALDWLLYDKSQRPEALRQANAIIRQFLISRKVSAAKVLFQKVSLFRFKSKKFFLLLYYK